MNHSGNETEPESLESHSREPEKKQVSSASALAEAKKEMLFLMASLISELDEEQLTVVARGLATITRQLVTEKQSGQ